MNDPKFFTPSGKFAPGHPAFANGKRSSTRERTPGNAIGELLHGLMKEKGWTLRDLEKMTREDEYPGYVGHQHISEIIRGIRVPTDRVLNRLLKPFGYQATQELRVEPIKEEVNEREA